MTTRVIETKSGQIIVSDGTKEEGVWISTHDPGTYNTVPMTLAQWHTLQQCVDELFGNALDHDMKPGMVAFGVIADPAKPDILTMSMRTSVVPEVQWTVDRHQWAALMKQAADHFSKGDKADGR